MRRRTRCGFTLAELLAVISIIALVAAILVPTFSRTFDLARRTICAGKLEKIGQAYHGRRSDEEWTPEGDEMNISGWAGALKPWLGNDDDAFICPETDPCALPGHVDLSSLLVRSYGPNRYTSIWETTVYTLEPDLPAGRQYRTLWWQVLQRDDQGFRIALEDSWQDTGPNADYNDLVLRFDTVPEGVKATYVSMGTGAFHYALMYPDQSIIMEGMGRGCNGDNYGMSAVIEGRERTSYGMNSVADRFSGPKDVILVLDYNERLARCSLVDDLHWFEWDELIGARHLGKCNVLFATGAVRTMSPETIRPKPMDAARWWGP
jgi:prepilin-type N-terminal cleavage/methylation domain-containing protein